jgi:hypothetical protein
MRHRRLSERGSSIDLLVSLLPAQGASLKWKNKFPAGSYQIRFGQSCVHQDAPGSRYVRAGGVYFGGKKTLRQGRVAAEAGISAFMRRDSALPFSFCSCNRLFFHAIGFGK